MRVRRTSSVFPIKETADVFKKRGWLKAETCIEINSDFSEYQMNLRRKFFSRYFWFSYLLYWISYALFMAKVIPLWALGPFLLFFISTNIEAVPEQRHYLMLGFIEKSEVFRKFLDKFGRCPEVIIAEIPSRIFGGIFRAYRRRWWIEYGILVKALELHQNNPEELREITKKAANKEQLRWLLGVS